jgi:hypothetical protein
MGREFFFGKKILDTLDILSGMVRRPSYNTSEEKLARFVVEEGKLFRMVRPQQLFSPCFHMTYRKLTRMKLNRNKYRKRRIKFDGYSFQNEMVNTLC